MEVHLLSLQLSSNELTPDCPEVIQTALFQTCMEQYCILNTDTKQGGPAIFI